MAHLAVLVGWQWSLLDSAERAASPLLAPMATTVMRPDPVPMRYRPIALAPVTPRGMVQRAPRASPAVVAPPASRPPAVVAVAPPSAPSAPGDTGRLAPAAAPTPVVAAAPSPRSPLTPAYGSGRLWVQPLPMSPREIAATLAGKSMDEVADSLVAVMVQQYIDALAAERANPANRPPSWTTTIGGKKVGIDGQWIYIGPIKLPTALLGLLPINMQGNPTQAEMNKRLNAMREDLFFAARRAATLEEFKKNVAELRKQKQYEYDLRKAQRTLPDSGRP
ncbi:MAG: hypothetical protein IPJ11_12705 [Gemmatimonadetes bacterium]|nr:hypothetical protein [Gemmatimonadota bacterium]